jgi:uncharacterized protein YbjT (DUF2867 family)
MVELMTKPTKILVTGATGTQGGAVIRALAGSGISLRGITRNIDSASAQALAASGVEVVAGDLADRGSLDAAVRGVDAVFSVATPYEQGVDAETTFGVNVADAAKAAGAFLLYSSVANADRNTGIPHFNSKYAVENHIVASGVRHTILAPVAFMDNVKFAIPQLKEGMFPQALAPDRKLGLISVKDIAACAAAVLVNPDAYAGKRYDLGADEPTGAEMTKILSAAIGKPLTYFQMPLDLVHKTMGDDGVAMWQWFDKVGYSFNRAQLAKDFPSVTWTSYAHWANGVDWKALLVR